MPEPIDDALLQRRAKREARREQQRQQNVVRAEKMRVARLKTATRKNQPKKLSKRIEFYIGCSGWFYWHWRGIVYPEEIPTNKWFEYYVSRFRTVELNAPFYSWPTIATVKSWLRQIGRRRFSYTVKVCELITHSKRFEGTKELIRDFGYIADLLGPRMGCFLFQLPPSFHYTSSRLNLILRQLDHSRRNVVEFRHASWWNDEVYEAFRHTNTIFCNCSAPRLPDTLVRTADEIYIRFHGTSSWYRHNYSKDELAVWLERANQSGARRVWAYFNNDREGYAVTNAREFLKQLKQSKSHPELTKIA